MSKDLVEDISELMKRKDVKEIIEKKLEEFKRLGSKGSCEEIFSELSFCVLTANYSAEGAILIQRKIGSGFLTLPLESLAEELREMGHRYPEKRALFIVKNRPLLGKVCNMVRGGGSGKQHREWLVENVYGFGMKEASHFLRNVGFSDVAILDFHILDLLERYGIIRKPKSLTKRRYLEMEKILENIAAKLGIKLDALDLYMWFMETGKVLK